MKECLTCKHCSVEDIWNELICLKRNKELCPTLITKDNDLYYPACEEYELEEDELEERK